MALTPRGETRGAKEPTRAIVELARNAIGGDAELYRRNDAYVERSPIDRSE